MQAFGQGYNMRIKFFTIPVFGDEIATIELDKFV
jgi:hypothetical protein